MWTFVPEQRLRYSPFDAPIQRDVEFAIETTFATALSFLFDFPGRVIKLSVLRKNISRLQYIFLRALPSKYFLQMKFIEKLFIHARHVINKRHAKTRREIFIKVNH